MMTGYVIMEMSLSFHNLHMKALHFVKGGKETIWKTAKKF
ncbi:Uncharacterised protein [Chlamydia abortus]|nr:Uncharacterised protein [Chlamydia abortus]